jgi:hypothetical protein
MVSSRCASVSTIVVSEVDFEISEAEKKHHQERRFGEKADQHLAPRAERAEGSTDIHRRQRNEHPGKGEQADQGNGVGRRRQRQVGGQRRNDRAGQRHAAENDVGRAAKQWRSVLGKHRFLVEQLVQHPVGLQQAGCRLVLQPGAPLIDPAAEQGGQQQRHDDLQQLRENTEPGHCFTTTSTAISVTKL